MPVYGRPVFKTGTLASSATTADQVILSYEVSPAKAFTLEYLEIDVMLTTFAATATYFGTVSLETPSGTKLLTWRPAGSGMAESGVYEPAEPLTIVGNSNGQTIVRVVCTPSASTAFTWTANMVGYET